MSNISKKIHVDQDHKPTGDESYWFWCPGCDAPHRYVVGTGPEKVHWTFNGDMEKPSFQASFLQYEGGTHHRCHLYMTDGKIHFLSDCTHPFAGKTVDIPPLPDWLK